jgi:NCS1 family nucleobase:cation symporter-1
MMWIAGALSIAVALVFPMEQYESFLLFIGAMFVPLFGVVLTDYFVIRRGRISPEELFRQKGAYWYKGGFHFPALLSWAAGFAVFELIAFTQCPIGGSIPSLVVAGVFYFLIVRRRERS